MATSSKNMKAFYRQKKSTTTSAPKKSTKTPSPKDASDISQTPALVSHDGSLDLKEADVCVYLRETYGFEQVLRQFDMNMAYGPCLGIPPLARWERAQRMGLNPPEEIGSLLKGGGEERLEGLYGVETVAQFGVIFLLFALGLEFSIAKLRVVRAVAVLGGLLQIVLFMCLCGITASRVWNVRKRQCFRSNAKEIGFIKYR
ncbi:hypothetical protein GQ457_12G009830 [Hibiscus cannabinus]